MGLAKVLFLRGSKETGVPKCVRVDSLGLAKRRLAAKAAREEVGADVADLDGVGAGRDGDSAPAAQDLLDPAQQDDSEALILGEMGRQHRDSIRIARRRFRERASLDMPSLRAKNAALEKGASWSSGGSPTSPGAQVGQDNEQDNEGDGASPERASCPTNAARHVRFRRASDGEYLTASRAHKAAEGAIPHALKAVQLKAERLFKRLTANFTESHPPRPRSATPSRGGSPTRPQRSSASRAAPASRAASGSRSSASWGLGLRHRSASSASPGGGGGGVEADDEGQDDDDGKVGRISPSAATRAAVAAEGEGDSDAGGRQRWSAQRQSAPGELFFTSIVGGAAVTDPATSPPLTPSGTQRTRSVTKDVPNAGVAHAGSSPAPGTAAAAGGSSSSVGKGLNWLARISRGLGGSNHGSSAYKSAAMAAAPPGSGGGQAGMTSPGPTRGSGEPEAATVGHHYYHNNNNALESSGGGGGGGGGGDGGATQAVLSPVAVAAQTAGS